MLDHFLEKENLQFDSYGLFCLIYKRLAKMCLDYKYFANYLECHGLTIHMRQFPFDNCREPHDISVDDAVTKSQVNVQ